jgi:DNA-binding NarL/FixJ family response regulator
MAQRLLVVDDHRVFADLLTVALADDHAFTCVGTAHSVDQARQVAAEVDFDVALVDVRLPDGSGLDLAEHLMDLRPAARVVLLTAYPRRDLLDRARACGVAGVIPKDVALDDLLAGLTSADPNALWLAGVEDVVHNLTDRELQVLRYLGNGHEHRMIARELNISPYTARDHIKRILSKLGAHSQLDAVVAASKAGIIEIGHR